MRYVILFTLAVLTAGLAYVLRDRHYWFVDNLGGNLAAGFIGSLAILFFIERAVEKKRIKERERIARLACNQMTQPLQQLVDFFANMIKASRPEPFASLPASLNDLFSRENTANIDWLDLDGSTGRRDYSDWKGLSEFVLGKEIGRTTAILDRYLPFFEPQFIEDVEALITDVFLKICQAQRRTAETVSAGKIGFKLTLHGTESLRNQFFDRLLAVENQLRIIGVEGPHVPTSLVRQDMTPKAGVARLKELPRPVLVGKGDPPIVDSTKNQAPTVAL